MMRAYIVKLRTIFLYVLVGLLMTMLIKLAHITDQYVELSDVQNGMMTLEHEYAEVKQLEGRVQEITEQIQLYQGEQFSRGDIEDSLSNRVLDIKKFAGLTRVNGPGVVLILNDGDRELHESEDPNNLLVHNIDVQNLVDNLRYAGAEAISINGERYIFGHTKIQCTGPTLRINNTVFAQPFIIKAIGNKQHLEASVNAPGAFGQVLRRYGVFLEVYTSVNLEIPAYSGVLNSQYMKTIESGENS